MRIVVTVRGGSVEDIFVAHDGGGDVDTRIVRAAVLDYDTWVASIDERNRGECVRKEVSPFGLLVNQAWGDGTLPRLRREGMIMPQEDFFPTILSAVEGDAGIVIEGDVGSAASLLYVLIPLSPSLIEDVLAARQELSALQRKDITYSAVERKDITPYWIQHTPEALERYICFEGRYVPSKGSCGWMLSHLPQAFFEGTGAYDKKELYEACMADVRDVTLHVEEHSFWWSGVHEGELSWEVHTAAIPIEQLFTLETKMREEGLL